MPFPDFWPYLYKKNKGIFYRGISGNSGAGVAYMGEGMYLTWEKDMAKSFGMFSASASGKKEYSIKAYKVPFNLKLLDAKSELFYMIKEMMGVDRYAKIGDPLFAKMLAFEIKKRRYEGVLSDDVADGLVLFDSSKTKLVETEKFKVVF